MPVNTMDVLGVTYNEKVISNLIVGLTNYSKNFKTSFLEHILEIPNGQQYRVDAYAKIGTSKGVPDIIVQLENDSKIIINVIECKLKANSGHNQTIVYAEDEIRQELIFKEKNKEIKKDIEHRYVYLTLEEDEDKDEKDYITKSFKDLIEMVWVEIEDEVLDRIYKDFCSKMMDYYAEKELPENNNSINVLLDSSEEEKMFIKFREIILSLFYPNNLKVEFFGKGTIKDELSFISKHVKSGWLGREAKWNGEVYEIQKDTFDIHIETVFHVTDEKLSLYIHYEPNPYISRYRLKDWCNPLNVESFEERRDIVKESIHKQVNEIKDSHLKAYNGTNGVAYVEFKFNDGTTIGDFKELLIYYLEILSNIVDKALECVK